MKVYLDNAATTPLDPEVFDAMEPFLRNHFGNPSSTHSHGREARTAVEKARKTVAELINATPAEIYFTSGGTEADNTALRCSALTYDLKHAITSKIEHHAVLHTLEIMEEQGLIKLSFVDIDDKGRVDLDHLSKLMEQNPGSLVSLMHANNEIGNLLDLKRATSIVHEQKGYMHSDTVQAMGHYVHDAKDLLTDFMVGAAHKFHGPKGCGFLYVRKESKISPFVYGGGQERDMRGGTENVAGIVGLAKALEIAYRDMQDHQKHIQSLKDRMIVKLRESIPDVNFNGLSDQGGESLYTVLNVCLPDTGAKDLLLFNLDIQGVSASGGSACSSGALQGSHVLQALGTPEDRASIRFSFSKFNTEEEIDYAVGVLAGAMSPTKV